MLEFPELFKQRGQAVLADKVLSELEQLQNVGLDLGAVHQGDLLLQLLEEVLQGAGPLEVTVPGVDILLRDFGLLGRQGTGHVELELDHVVFNLANAAQIAFDGGDAPNQVSFDPLDCELEFFKAV